LGSAVLGGGMVVVAKSQVRLEEMTAVEREASESAHMMGWDALVYDGMSKGV
jgi:hypothetical protein